MGYVVSGLLIVAGIIHLLPVVGILGADRLAVLYGVSFEDPNLAILMRHRAVLFGLLGAFLVFAAFRPGLQWIALIAGLASVVSFLYLGWQTGGYNDSIRKVMIADGIALICLTAAAGFRL